MYCNLGYLGKAESGPNYTVTDGHGNAIGHAYIRATWHTPRSYVSSTMHQVECVINGRLYTGRCAGVGMCITGREKASSVRYHAEEARLTH